MRSLCSGFLGMVFALSIISLAPGCGSGASDLEKVPEIKQNPTMADMPGYNDMQEKLKKEGKIRKR